MSKTGWFGVDLDGTLAMDGPWKGLSHVGEPIPAMVARVKTWVASGQRVKIMTARASIAEPERSVVVEAIQDWLVEQKLPRLEVTSQKDFEMLVLYDDRCIQVEPNTGRLVG